MTNRLTVDARMPVVDSRRIDDLCDRFEAAWRASERPELGSYLALGSPEIRAALFGNLLQIELANRVRSGEMPDLKAYCAQFAEFREIVNAEFATQNVIVGKPPAFDQTGANDDSTIASSRMDGRAGSEGDPDRDDGAPRWKLAGYEIEGELGRGGMGVVYKARQTALQRDVALKVIKSGNFALPAELSRFQNEAEAVAQLDHPHIVPIYDVGEYKGLHFFSMKLIVGAGLDKRLDDFIANPRAAAMVVATAAEAVHHAHQRGILHRDLKPANILLDHDGQPHVTDFGLAKRIDSTNELSHSGALVGTPSYMAPEQAAQERGAVSTATDVYGLGTILYATLSGRAPFAGTTLVDTLNMVRSQSPDRPSALNARVPKDLEIICLKCLEKDPRRRYQSALEVAEDLRRWLDGIPIHARSVGSLRRVAMWCRRNRAVAAASAVVLIAIVASAASFVSRWRAVEHASKVNQAVIELLTTRLLAQASPERDPLAKNLTVRELLDRASYGIGGWLDGEPEIEAKIRETLGSAYLALEQNDKAEVHLKRAITLDTERLGPGHPDTLRATNLLASLLDQTGHGEQAEARIDRNLEDCVRFLGPNDPITLDAAARRGAILWHRRKLDAAESELRKNVDDRRRVLKSEHPDTLRSVYLLSRVLLDRKRLAEAQRFAEEYAHSVQCSMGRHPDNVLASTNLGEILRAQGKLAQAEPCYRRAVADAQGILGDDHPTTRAAVKMHAEVLGAMGQAPASL